MSERYKVTLYLNLSRALTQHEDQTIPRSHDGRDEMQLLAEAAFLGASDRLDDWGIDLEAGDNVFGITKVEQEIVELECALHGWGEDDDLDL